MHQETLERAKCEAADVLLKFGAKNNNSGSDEIPLMQRYASKFKAHTHLMSLSQKKPWNAENVPEQTSIAFWILLKLVVSQNLKDTETQNMHLGFALGVYRQFGVLKVQLSA